ncbi:hypothetical protein LCL97_10310 [Seohaeicola saemankumensis]|nr:hypothetical protein [Seohaeicola saemankumensis]MCA0871222.1 hypothetical protein [Seohaeicola saemankumensis]
METDWKLNATVLPEVNGFADVVQVVHWECFASEGDTLARLYGAVDLPPPTDPETYVDLSAIQEASGESRRAIILGWAEQLQPGFVAATEAAAMARLQERLAQSAPAQVTLL